ncbi:MAG: GC-type dockerin domain-anchored protein [Phycisphaerales bacterium]
MSSQAVLRGVVALGAIAGVAHAQEIKQHTESMTPRSVRTSPADMSWFQPAGPLSLQELDLDAAPPAAHKEALHGRVDDPSRGLPNCSDGSGLNVNAEWGTLGPGVKILTSSTVGYGPGVCGYSYFGSPIGFVETGGEIIYHFRVDRNLVARVDNYEGIFVGTDQDHYLLNGTFTFYSNDINAWGLNSGLVADDCIGFVDEDGPMLTYYGAQAVLHPGVDYYFIVDSYNNENGPFDIDFVLTPAPCSDGSGLNVDFASGVLSAGAYAAISSTVGYGSGICGYSYFGTPFQYLETGAEIIYSFQVDERMTAAIDNYEGIFVGTDQDHYLLNGTYTFSSGDIFGLGIGSGTVADDCVGFVDEDGPFLDAFHNPTVLEPGITYYLVVDSFNGQNGPFDIDLDLFRAPCNVADMGYPAGVLDFSDVFAFLVAFGNQYSTADLATPFGVFDFSDVFAFLVAFGGGCL